MRTGERPKPVGKAEIEARPVFHRRRTEDVDWAGGAGRRVRITSVSPSERGNLEDNTVDVPWNDGGGAV